MPTDRMALDADSLLREDRFLRGLARSLIADPARADDLVQHAWLLALRSPPRKVGAIRAWLTTTVRRLATRERTTELARQRRELAVARPNEEPSVDAVLAREATRQRVVQALVDLPRTYSRILVLRYLEEMKPAAIAKRLDIPCGTVRSKISRGLAMMREQLDAEHDDQRLAWTLPMAGVAFPSGAAPSAGIALRGWLLAGSAALSFGTIVWIGSAGVPSQTLEPATMTGQVPDVETRRVPRVESDADRISVPTHRTGEAIRTRLVHAQGRPAIGLRYGLRPGSTAQLEQASEHGRNPGHLRPDGPRTGPNGEMVFASKRGFEESLLWIKVSDALSVGFRTNAIDAVAQLKLPPIAEIALTVPGADADEDWRVFCTPRSPVDITIDPADGRTTILVPVGSAAQPGEPAWHAHSWIRRWCTGAESSTLTIAEGQWFELRGEAERHRVATPPIAISRTRRVAFALGDVLPSMIVRVLDPGGRQVTALDGEVFVECSSRGLDSNHRLLVDGVDRVGFGDILEGEPVTIHIVMADGEVFRRSLAIRGRNATLLEFERGQGELPTWLRIEQTFDSEFAALTLWLRGKSGPISYVERVESPCLPGPTLRQFHAESVALYRLPPSARTVWVTAPNGVILHAHSLGGTADLRGTRMDSDEFQINLSAVAIRRGLRQTVAFTYEVQLPFLDTTDWVVIDELTLQPERDQAPVVWQKTRPVHLPYRVRIHVSQQAPEIIPLSR